MPQSKSLPSSVDSTSEFDDRFDTFLAEEAQVFALRFPVLKFVTGNNSGRIINALKFSEIA